MANIKPLKVQVIADTKRFNVGMKNAGRGVQKFSSDSKAHLRGLKNTMSGLTGKLPMLAGFLGTAALIKAGKDVIDFDEKMARLRIDAKMSAEDIIKLEKRFFELSKTTSQSVKEMLSGYSAIIGRTGDVKLANETLERMGIIATATGSSMEDVGSTFTNLKEKIGLSVPAITRVMNIFAEQGKTGAFSLKKMAKELPQILSTASGFGIKSEKGMRSLGAFMQIAMRAFGGLSEQARTGIQGVLKEIPMRREKIAEVFKFDIFTKKNGVQTLKSFDEILRNILTASKGNALLLGDVFSGVALDTLKPLLSSYQKFGFQEYNTFMNVVSDDKALMKDFGIMAATTAAQLGSLSDQLFELSTQVGAKPIVLLNKALTELNEMQFFTNIGTIVGKLTEMQNLDLAYPFRQLNEVLLPIIDNMETIISIVEFAGWAQKLPFEALKAVTTEITHIPPVLMMKNILGINGKADVSKAQKLAPKPVVASSQALNEYILSNRLKTIQNNASNNISNNTYNTINNQAAMGMVANKEQVTNINIHIDNDGVTTTRTDNGRVHTKTTTNIKRQPFFREMGR